MSKRRKHFRALLHLSFSIPYMACSLAYWLAKVRKENSSPCSFVADLRGLVWHDGMEPPV